jgi:VanZ family protein
MTSDSPSRPSRLVPTALAAWTIALVWGSLFPMSGWRDRGAPLLGFLLDPWPRWWTAFDLVFNVAIYLPGGMLGAMLLRHAGWRRAALPVALLACSAAALGLEALQSLLPGRVPSRMDWLANTAGALLGALLAPWGERAVATGQRALDARQAIGATDSALGVLLLASWLVIQWPPQRLLFGQGDLQPLLASLLAFAGAGGHPASWRLAPAYTELLEALGVATTLVGIGLIVREVLPTRTPRAAVTAGLVCAAIAIKLTGSASMGEARMPGWLTAGAQGGLLTGAVLLALLASARRRTRLSLAIAALAASAACSTLLPLDPYVASAQGARLAASWRNLEGLLRDAAMAWPCLAIAWCALRLRALEPGVPPPEARL